MKSVVRYFRDSIQLKTVSLIILSLLLTFLSILFIIITTERENLLDSADNTLATNTEMLNRSVRVIMLNGEAPLAVQTLRSLQSISELENIAIYRTDGTLAFSDFETLNEVNGNIGRDMFEETPRLPGSSLQNNHFDTVINQKIPVKIRSRELETIEYYFPMINTPDCRGCHGADHFIRGVQHLEISVATVYQRINQATLTLTLIFIIAGIVIAAVLILFIRSMIIRPLRKIGNAVQNVSAGNLNVKVNSRRSDEFGVIERHTNEMIDSLRQRTEEIQTTQDVTILSLASIAETRDNETGNHIIRTEYYVRILGEYLRNNEEYTDVLTDEMLTVMYKSAPLHDIGKVGIPDSILLKAGPLSDEEWLIMKSHPQLGHDALKVAEERLGTSSFLSTARELIISHHEKWDGTGYPSGFSGKDIPLSGRLMALADVYDALLSERPYKKAFTHEEAKTIILQSRGTHFDPMIADAFIAEEKTFIDISKRYKD